jgi:hypothetical protein
MAEVTIAVCYCCTQLLYTTAVRYCCTLLLYTFTWLVLYTLTVHTRANTPHTNTIIHRCRPSIVYVLYSC